MFANGRGTVTGSALFGVVALQPMSTVVFVPNVWDVVANSVLPLTNVFQDYRERAKGKVYVAGI